MSILNHFGKVKASYKKYEGDLPEYTGYVCNKNNYFLENPTGNKIHHLDKVIFQANGGGLPKIETYMEQYHGNVKTISISDTYYHSLSPETYVFSFTTLVETFSKCFEKVREKMYSDLWKTIECCPFINIMDLLILKQSDTDKHIEHVENMIRSLLDDNKLLQNRINALEAQMKRNTIPVAVVVKTIGEELVYESV